MFHVLLASDARVPRRSGWGVASTAAHLTLVAGAVALTITAPARPDPEPPIAVVPLQLFQPAQSAPTIPDLPRADLPGTIDLSIELLTVPIVQTNFGSVAVSLTPNGTAGADLLRDAFHTPVLQNGIHYPTNVERQVIPRPDNPAPEYPSSLRSAMVEGSVLVQFVVDTTGHVEHPSIAVMRATHEQFAVAVKRWLARTRYTPAQIGGRPVRQLVQQEVAFTLDR